MLHKSCCVWRHRVGMIIQHHIKIQTCFLQHDSSSMISNDSEGVCEMSGSHNENFIALSRQPSGLTCERIGPIFSLRGNVTYRARHWQLKTVFLVYLTTCVVTVTYCIDSSSHMWINTMAVVLMRQGSRWDTDVWPRYTCIPVDPCTQEANETRAQEGIGYRKVRVAIPHDKGGFLQPRESGTLTLLVPLPAHCWGHPPIPL